MLDALVAWLWHLSTMVDQLSYVDKSDHQLGQFYVAQWTLIQDAKCQ